MFFTELVALPPAFRCRQSPKICFYVYGWRCRYCPRLSLESSIRPSANHNWIPITKAYFNPLNAELNPICHMPALLGAHHIFHVSVLRVNIHLHSRNLGYQISSKFNSPNHYAVCLTTGPQPLLKRVLRRVRSSASSFNFSLFLKVMH